MPFKIQRVPRGLNELLSIAGGVTPTELEDRVRSTLDILQFYGLQQRQTGINTNAALAEAAFVNLIPSSDRWSILFAATATVGITATMTALTLNVILQRGGPTDMTLPVATGIFSGFGATATGSWHVPFVPPYPILLPPNAQIAANMGILGTDATASVTIRAEFGILS